MEISHHRLPAVLFITDKLIIAFLIFLEQSVFFCSYTAQAPVGKLKASPSSMLHAEEIKRIAKIPVTIQKIRL